MTSKKDNYKAVLERETIAACLLKFLVPEAPVNAYENEKNNLRLSQMKLLLAAVAVVSGAVMAAAAVIYSGGNSYINMVKDGYPEIYPNITYGEAFDAFFGDCKWKYFELEDGRDVVEFHGNCMYGDEQAEIMIQFLVYEDKGTFEIHTAALDGKEQSELVYSMLLLKMFESYNGDSTKGELQLDDLENDVSVPAVEAEKYAYEGSEADEEFSENTDDFNAWIAGLEGTINFDSIRRLSGQWSDGHIELSFSIYTDADQYVTYDEIGTCFYGEILGTLYFLGRDDTNLYLMGELAQGDVFILQYWGDEKIEMIDASEGLSSGIGAVLIVL